jgi:hypothetical protein
MKQTKHVAAVISIVGLFLVCTGALLGGSRSTVAVELSAQQVAFLDELTQDTWTYLSSDWATSNHLPWSWRSETISGTASAGGYANPAEIGLYALSWLAAYDLQRSWSPTWSETEAEVSAILDQLRAWQSGSQGEQPNGPNAYNNQVFYQWYWIFQPPPVVGANDRDHLVPSIDNAWLAASLITIRAYAQANDHAALAQMANAILNDMDFSLWYHADTHRFSWGEVDDPQGGGQADYYSNENRIINFVARALGQLSSSEYRLSMEVLEQPPGTYSGITVDKISWDGSYFTYATPALFIREMETSYGTDTILAAAQAQEIYAQHESYDAWGLSDCFDVADGGYVQQGAPPVAMPDPPETRPGLVTPHASALTLITSLSSQAVTNLQMISDTFDCAYDPLYGFRDSVMANSDDPDYGQCSNRFSALAQEWIFLALVNYETGFIWDYFYQDTGVRIAHEDLTGEYYRYLPAVFKPPSTPTPTLVPPLLVADFDNCGPPNNLGGDMGAAYNSPDQLSETYPDQTGRGCVASLEYHITNWAAFWMKLQHADLSQYNWLTFEARSEQPPLPTHSIKIELKRLGNTEIEVTYVSGIAADWQTMRVNLADFDNPSWDQPISDWGDIEELVFTFERQRSGSNGVVVLDNVGFEP